MPAATGHKYSWWVLWSVICLCILRGGEYIIDYLGVNTDAVPALSLVLNVVYFLILTLLVLVFLSFLYMKLSIASLFGRAINTSNFLLLTFSIFFAVIEAELFLQFFYEPPQIISGWKACEVMLCDSNPYARSQLNILGYRGQPIRYDKDDYVVVLLGDSQVEAWEHHYMEMPEKMLQYYLNSYTNWNYNVKVFTVGAGGYGQDQQLLALKEYYRTYRADLVILWQTPANDIWNNIFPSHWPTNGTPKPTYWLEDDKLCGPSEQHIRTSLVPRIRLLALWKNIFYSKRDDLWGKKYLGDYEPYIPLDRYEGPVKYDWQEKWEQNIGLMRQENLKIDKSHYSFSLTPRSPRMLYGLKLTRALLQEIEQLVRDHGGRFIILNTDEPLKKDADGSPLYEEEVRYLSGKYYKTSEKQYYENLDYVNRGFESAAIPLTVEDWAVSAIDKHLNLGANYQVMRDLGHKLAPLISTSDTEKEE